MDLKILSIILYNIYFFFISNFFFNSHFKKYLRKKVSLDYSQEKEFIELIKDIDENVEYYKNIISKKSINFDNKSTLLHKFDIITKEIIRNNFNKLSSKNNTFNRLQKTSGSTGKPLQFYRSISSFINSQCSFYEFFLRLKINRFDKNIYIGGVRSRKNWLRSKIKSLTNRIIFNQVKFAAADIVTESDYKKIISKINSFKPIYISGFSHALVRLAQFIVENDIVINSHIKLVHPTAETITEIQKNILEKAFKPGFIRMVYGSSECHMASECEHGRMHINEVNCIIETDKENEVELTVLGSNNFPFIRYKLGDQIKIDNDISECECGQKSKVIHSIVGRSQDKLILSNGIIMTHPDINMFIEQIDNNNQIYEYQLIYWENLDSLEMIINASELFDKNKFSDEFKTRFNLRKFAVSEKEFYINSNGKKPILLRKKDKKLIRKHFDNYEPYLEISKSQKNQYSKNILKLDWNESTEDFPKNLKNELIKKLQEINLNYYPDVKSLEIRKSLARKNNLDENNIHIFNGSDAAIDTISRLFIEANDRVIIINPTYGNYAAISQKYGAKIIHLNLMEPFKLEKSELDIQIESNFPKIIFIANPNNPTGNFISIEIISELVEKHKDSIFVIDEAYIEFGGESFVSKVNLHENVFVTRTFSKAYGLAGARIGYTISSKNNYNLLKFAKDNKEVSIFGQIIGSIAVNNDEYMYKYVSEVKKSKEILINYLNNNDIKHFGLYGNFLLIRVKDPKQTIGILNADDVFVRDRSYLHGLEGYIRVTIGDIKTTEKFIQVLKERNIK
tara:strand:+ start:128 stop:2506 length:2379 start_codon:yes stop_codon:yes gene_type:complete